MMRIWWIFIFEDFLDADKHPMIDVLDEQALRSIRTMILVEFARCSNK